MFFYFIIGNVILKLEQILISVVYGYIYSKLFMFEINVCLYVSEFKLLKLYLVL